MLQRFVNQIPSFCCKWKR